MLIGGLRYTRCLSRQRFQNRHEEWSFGFIFICHLVFTHTFQLSCAVWRVTFSFSESEYRFLKLLGAHMADNDQSLPHPRPAGVRKRVRAANAARREGQV